MKLFYNFYPGRGFYGNLGGIAFPPRLTLNDIVQLYAQMNRRACTELKEIAPRSQCLRVWQMFNGEKVTSPWSPWGRNIYGSESHSMLKRWGWGDLKVVAIRSQSSGVWSWLQRWAWGDLNELAPRSQGEGVQFPSYARALVTSV